MAPPEPLPRGLFHSVVHPVLGGVGEWAPRGTGAPNGGEDVEEDPGQADYSVHLSEADLYNGREFLDDNYG